MKNYRDFLLEKERGEKEKSALISFNVINVLRTYIPEIVDKYPSIKKIVVFGSVINKSMNDYSDVDIFIDGIESFQYWELLGSLSSHLKRDVDLLTPQDDRYLAGIIEKNGEVLYERKNQDSSGEYKAADVQAGK
jgi:predicted nucleotidyltransferase